MQYQAETLVRNTFGAGNLAQKEFAFATARRGVDARSTTRFAPPRKVNFGSSLTLIMDETSDLQVCLYQDVLVPETLVPG